MSNQFPGDTSDIYIEIVGNKVAREQINRL